MMTCRSDRGISIHALREEGDTGAAARLNAISEFLSTPSARRATGDHRRDARIKTISIHALREEHGNKFYKMRHR